MNTPMILWKHWTHQIGELFPSMHGHQQKTLALLVQGIVMSGSVVLQRIAETLGIEEVIEAKMSSIERRLSRFLANPRIKVEVIWDTFIREILNNWPNQPMTFVLDMTPYRSEFTIVYLGLLVHSRVLPVAWAVMPGQEKWEEKQWSIVGRLLDLVQSGVRKEANCTLIADRGLSGMPLVKLCQDRHWHYLLRINHDHTFRVKSAKGWSEWKPVKSFVEQPGKQWYGAATVWQESSLETHISACWTSGYEEPWVLISDQKAGKGCITAYSKRMRVEATFQDTKSRGYDLEASGITDEKRLHRLLFGLFLAMWWVCHLAAACMHHGARSRFDRVDRRDKSILRIGRLWLLSILKQAKNSSCGSAHLVHCLPFSKRNGNWTFIFNF